MLLDRAQLAQYVGCDLAFEQQFLALLHDSIASCLAALSNPTASTYSVLHAAKAGISVASTDELRDLLGQACDRSAEAPHGELDAELREVLSELHAKLTQFSKEIETVL